jgi:hypothetical protein
MMEYISELISGAVLVIVSLIEVRATRERKKRSEDKEKTEKRAALRAEESLLSMQIQEANLSLSLATALAVERQKTNGEMKEAREKAKLAQDKYLEFMLETTAHAHRK